MAQPLSVFFSPEDVQVQELIEEAIVPVAVYYTLESLKCVPYAPASSLYRLAAAAELASKQPSGSTQPGQSAKSLLDSIYDEVS